MPKTTGIRNEFTIEHDRALARYLAVHNPAKAGRSGRAIYEQIERHAAELGPWASAHSWQAWQTRYRKREEYFNALISRFQHELHVDASAPQRLLNPELRPMDANRKRTRAGETASQGAKRVKLDHDGEGDGDGEGEGEVLDTSRDTWDRPVDVRSDRRDEPLSLLDLTMHSQAPAPSRGPPTPPHTNSIASPHSSASPSPQSHTQTPRDLSPPFAQRPRPTPTPRPDSDSDDPTPKKRKYPRQYEESPFRRATTASNGRRRISAGGTRSTGVEEGDMRSGSRDRAWPPPRTKKVDVVQSDDRRYPTNTDMDNVELSSPVPRPAPAVVRRPQVNAVASSSRVKLPDAVRLSPSMAGGFWAAYRERTASPPLRRAATPVVSPPRERSDTPRVVDAPSAPAHSSSDQLPVVVSRQDERRHAPAADAAARVAPDEQSYPIAPRSRHAGQHAPAAPHLEEDEQDATPPPAARSVKATKRARLSVPRAGEDEQDLIPPPPARSIHLPDIVPHQDKRRRARVTPAATHAADERIVNDANRPTAGGLRHAGRHAPAAPRVEEDEEDATPPPAARSDKATKRARPSAPRTAVAADEDEQGVPPPPAARSVEANKRARPAPAHHASEHARRRASRSDEDEHEEDADVPSAAPQQKINRRLATSDRDVRAPAADMKKRRETFASFGRATRAAPVGARKSLPSKRRKSIAEPASQTYLSALRRQRQLDIDSDDLDLPDVPPHLLISVKLGLRQAIPGLVDRYGFNKDVVKNVIEAVKGDLGMADEALRKMRVGAGRAFRRSLGLVVGGEEEEAEAEAEEEDGSDGEDGEGEGEGDAEEVEADVEMEMEEDSANGGGSEEELVLDDAEEDAEEDEQAYESAEDNTRPHPASNPRHTSSAQPTPAGTTSPPRRRKPRLSKLHYTPLSPSRAPYSPPPHTKARTYVRLSTSGRHDEALERLTSSPAKSPYRDIHRAQASGPARRTSPSSSTRQPIPQDDTLPAPPIPMQMMRLRPASSRSMAEEEYQDFGDEDPFKVPHFEDPPSQAWPKSSQLPPSSQPQMSSQTLRSSQAKASLPFSSQSQFPSSSPGRLKVPDTPEQTEIRAWMRDGELERLREAEGVYEQGAMMRLAMEWVAERVGLDEEDGGDEGM
ncbi:unnamed protein product [Peniophora sp. CBMAI 1063]|nr:unnamed protein product [Peniophora sp. CBMAI 1063]